LAIITKAILNLVPLPTHTVDLLVPFETIPKAMDFVPKIMTQARLIPSSIEFMDSPSVRMTERFLNMRMPCSEEADAYLIIQLEGNNYDSLADEYEKVGDLCLDHGALEVFVADNRIMSDKLWKARKSIAEAVWALYPGENTLNEDIVVPTSEIPTLMNEMDRICNTHGAAYASYGHAGDGNMHVTIYFENDFDGSLEILHRLQEELYKTTRKLGGTLTGEHGVGLKRRDQISFFLDENQTELIRRVKLAFDPKNILNPGKIVPWRNILSPHGKE
jgi:glycolate oxidase